MDQSKSLNWNKISPSDFEKLCANVLSRQGFTNIHLIGGSGDRGRDIVASRFENVSPLIQIPETWIFQCKRYTTKVLSVSEIDANISWAKLHNPDFLVFIVSNTVTPNVFDWVENLKGKHPFKVSIWDVSFLENALMREIDLKKRYFSEGEFGATKEENQIIFGEKPNSLMVYTAGKMSSDAVRDSIAKWRLDLQEKVNSYHLDLGFYHPEYTGCDHTGIWPEETVLLDTTMLKKSDLVVAYIDQEELYGTLTEIMMAHYLNKDIAIFINKSIISNLDEGTDIYPIVFKTKHKCTCMLMAGPEFTLNKYWFPLEFLSQNHNNLHIEIVSDNEMLEKMAQVILDTYEMKEKI